MTDQERLTAARQDLLKLSNEISGRLKQTKDRRRAEDVRRLHEIRSMLDPLNGYASQAGQDRVIDRLFNGKRGGVFVDVGAYDGITGSNSYFFEKHRGWTGFMVEPVEFFRQKAERLRSSICLPFAVSDADGEAQFMAVTEGFTQMSGLVDQYDPAMLRKVRDDKRHKEDLVTVKTRKLADLLDDQGITAPDYISLDIEGGEVAALSTFPFSKYQIGAWSIENNSGSAEIRDIMQTHDYKLIEYCGPDEVYAHSSLI